MTKRMLIDATHSEETRMVVLNGNRLEEFDFETAAKRPLKGNIYLARVTRVEPSLQAAFVEYGGNRHGFLAFNEIHPDYYRIPIADREALVSEMEAEREEHANGNGDSVEVLGGDDVEEVQRRRPNLSRQYKIQEVVKRRQIMLVQVTKEERGTKGAALTTFLSLPGRYCVLMPNTSRGGGVSRKITNVNDRKRLKKIVEELELPDGMAVIVRTAGSERSKAEIKRDFDYLIKLWDDIRELTLQSNAPSLIYEEGNLIKRALRDIYDSEIEEVLLEGEEGYKSAKAFMKDLIPSHARKVQQYKDPVIPLFQRYQVESQLDAIHSPTVQLKSGGYIVMNQTEALVAIDVNSGRSTRERNIEETAYRTNLEAAEEVARQLRLRDLSGLIVIDFIDMEENRNQQAVERKLKEAMKNDRARIQIGRISHFGLLELSRQRLRPSVFETANQPCPHCGGTGYIRSTDTTALHVLRAIEEEGIRQRASEIAVYVPTQIALYILNQKRAALAQIEARYSFQVMIGSDDTLIPPAFRLERVRQRSAEEQAALEAAAPVRIEAPAEIDEDEDILEQDEAAETQDENQDGAQEGEAREGRRRRRRRSGRGGGRDGEQRQVASDESAETADGDEDAGESEDTGTPTGEKLSAEEEERQRKRRRRGRRGGRRRRRTQEEQDNLAASGETADSESDAGSADESQPDAAPAAAEAPEEAAQAADGAEKPKRSRRSRSAKKPAEVTAEAPAEAEAAPAAEEPEAEAPAKPKRPSRRKPKAEAAAAATDETVTAEAATEPAATPEADAEQPKPAPRKRTTRKAAAKPETAEAEKPKRTRAPRKPKAAIADAQEAAAPSEAAALTVEAAEAATPAATPAAGTVIVEVGQAETKEKPEEPAKPARRGWWSRAVGR
ncbi:Rne/Rng family ribonuclease [Oceanibaculum indicum]|uniref:Ribonuclease E n=1 Tax=Oceanibaculum indicum P24 TaxID=1207063 RepID=K2J9X3_9PROT|nr:ribonuclease E/G [Oceanibaculum indicum]EKE71607.1 RNAse E [Oceanibaculum indicum P24]